MKFAKALVQAGQPCCIPLCVLPISVDSNWSLASPVSWAMIQQNAQGKWELCLTAAASQATESLVLQHENCLEADGSYRYDDELTLSVETENTNRVFFDEFTGGQIDQNDWDLTFPWATTGAPNDHINHHIEGQIYTLDPNSGVFSACGATGLKITAMGPAGATTGATDGSDRPWTSGMIHQKNALPLLGGVYSICMRGSNVKGAFPGSWAIGKHGGCTEIDTSEGGNTVHPSEVHQAYHLIGGIDTSQWVPVCAATDDACHCYSFHYRLTDRVDANGCRIMQGAMTVDCIVTSDWQDVDFYETLHHIANLAVATVNGWPQIGNPPDQTSMDICICSVETREYTDGKSAAVPTATEPTITTTGQSPLNSNAVSDYLNVATNSNPVFNVGPGSVAGATMVRRDAILSKDDDCAVIPVSGTTFQITDAQAQDSGGNFNSTVFVRERHRAPDGTCFDVMSDAVYLGS